MEPEEAEEDELEEEDEFVEDEKPVKELKFDPTKVRVCRISGCALVCA